MIETDSLPVLLVNNLYGDDENSNWRKEVWNLDVTLLSLLLLLLNYN